MAHSFRPARKEELEQVCSLYRAASQNPFSVWDDDYPTMREAQHDFETGNLFVLTEDSRVIGALSIVPEREMDDIPVWTVTDGSQQEIARITISASHQGKGLAAVMVSNILSLLKKRGCGCVRLSAAACNLPARKTYQKLGFQVVGETDMYGSHYCLLETADSSQSWAHESLKFSNLSELYIDFSDSSRYYFSIKGLPYAGRIGKNYRRQTK